MRNEFDKCVKRYNKVYKRLTKLDKSLAKQAYKNNNIVRIVTKDGCVIEPFNYKAFKHAYKIEYKQDNVEEIIFIKEQQYEIVR